MRLAALLLLLTCLPATVRSSVKLCEQAQVWARGRELISALKGQLVLVAFPAASDKNTLQKLSSLAESHSHVRFVALLDPFSCTTEEAATMAREWRWLMVERDDVGSRKRLGLNQGEVALFDRCGRLSRSIALTATEELTQALRAAQHHAACGWCQYGTEKNGEGAGGTNTVEKKLDAFFQNALASPQSPHTGQQRVHTHQQQNRVKQQQQQHQNRQQQYTTQHHHQPNSQQQGAGYDRQMQMQQHQQQLHHQQLQQQQQQRGYPSASAAQDGNRTPQSSSSVHVGQPAGQITHHSQIRPHEYAQHGVNAPRTTGSAPSAPSGTPSQMEEYGDDYDEVVNSATTKTETVDLRKPAFNEDAQWATASPFHQRRPHKDLFARAAPSSQQQYSPAASQTSQASPATTAAQNPGAAPLEDYSDYEDYGAMKTFPGSTSSNGAQQLQHAEPPRTTQSRARSVDQPQRLQQQQNRDYEPQDEDEVNLVEVPCKAVTDDICYHQKKSGRKLSKCCKKGVYIADFCLPGKCSNTTTQACCMQKYLQAKFLCCEDAEMDGTTATDAFSRCCHAHFTAEDDCCPTEAAAEYWQSVHDICLPNVQVDLSGIKLEIRLSDGIRVLDMAETERWQHECKYGTRRAQYVYVP